MLTVKSDLLSHLQWYGSKLKQMNTSKRTDTL